jgi:hypothetical protein
MGVFTNDGRTACRIRVFEAFSVHRQEQSSEALVLSTLTSTAQVFRRANEAEIGVRPLEIPPIIRQRLNCLYSVGK